MPKYCCDTATCRISTNWFNANMRVAFRDALLFFPASQRIVCLKSDLLATYADHELFDWFNHFWCPHPEQKKSEIAKYSWFLGDSALSGTALHNCFSAQRNTHINISLKIIKMKNICHELNLLWLSTVSLTQRCLGQRSARLPG